MYALDKEGDIIHIDDAEKKVSYYCDNCGGELRVRVDSKKRKKFSHIGENCKSKGEKLTHRYWKEQISRAKKILEHNIVDSRIDLEIPKLKGKYVPDVVLKTDKGEYIIVDICVLTPGGEVSSRPIKNVDYYKQLKSLKKVYEIDIEYGIIIDGRKVYDREEYRQEYEKLKNILEISKNYIISKYQNDGGLRYRTDWYYPVFSPRTHEELKIDKNWIHNFERARITLSGSVDRYMIELETDPFYVNIYSWKPIEKAEYFGHLIIKELNFDIEPEVKLIDKYITGREKEYEVYFDGNVPPLFLSGPFFTL